MLDADKNQDNGKYEAISSAPLRFSTLLEDLRTSDYDPKIARLIRPNFTSVIAHQVTGAQNSVMETPTTQGPLYVQGVRVGKARIFNFAQLQSVVDQCSRMTDDQLAKAEINRTQVAQLRNVSIEIASGVLVSLANLSDSLVNNILEKRGSGQLIEANKLIGGNGLNTGVLSGMEEEIISHLRQLQSNRQTPSVTVPIPPRFTPRPDTTPRSETTPTTGTFLIPREILPGKPDLAGPKNSTNDILLDYYALSAMATMCTTSENASLLKQVFPDVNRLTPQTLMAQGMELDGRKALPLDLNKSRHLFNLKNGQIPDGWSNVVYKYGNIQPGEAAKRLLSDKSVTLLTDGTHFFVSVGISNEGRLIVWDPSQGEPTHSLCTVDPKDMSLRFVISAPANPHFLSSREPSRVSRIPSPPPVSTEIRFGTTKEFKDIHGRLVIPKDLLPGAVQENGDFQSCVYHVLGVMIHLCGGDNRYLIASENTLKSRNALRGLKNIIRDNNNQGRSRMTSWQARDYFNGTTPYEAAKLMSDLEIVGERVGQTAKRILSNDRVSMLFTGGHAVLTIGVADNGNLIVWDSLLGESQHGLREIDPNTKDLEFQMAAKINPYFKSRH